jgi:hypothetical protein
MRILAKESLSNKEDISVIDPQYVLYQAFCQNFLAQDAFLKG